MADDPTKKFKDSDMVRVKVLRGISVGGTAHRPVVDGSKITPTEAVIPFERARSFGPKYVEVLGPAEGQAEKQAETPADKQSRPDKTK